MWLELYLIPKSDYPLLFRKGAGGITPESRDLWKSSLKLEMIQHFFITTGVSFHWRKDTLLAKNSGVCPEHPK